MSQKPQRVKQNYPSILLLKLQLRSIVVSGVKIFRIVQYFNNNLFRHDEMRTSYLWPFAKGTQSSGQ